MDRPRLLLVEPDARWRFTLSAAAKHYADVDVAESFDDARVFLDETQFDLVVANLRLGAYNGIHLAYTVRLAELSTHVIVHSDARDVAAAHDIQRAGALYERTERLVVSMQAYLGGTLPSMDRRNPLQFDRRRFARGGRRAWDVRSFGSDTDAGA